MVMSADDAWALRSRLAIFRPFPSVQNLAWLDRLSPPLLHRHGFVSDYSWLQDCEDGNNRMCFGASVCPAVTQDAFRAGHPITHWRNGNVCT